MSKPTKWDLSPTHLCVYVVAARDLAAGDSNGLRLVSILFKLLWFFFFTPFFSSTSDPYAKLVTSSQKKSVKTKVIPKTLNPVWNELFLLDMRDGDLVVEVWDHDMIGSNDFLGYATITSDIASLEPNAVIDRWLRLVPRSMKDSNSVKGEVRVVLVWQPMPSLSASLSFDPRDSVFFYRRRGQFKVGDLVLFSLAGPISSALKAVTGSFWTHCGIVVAVPNAYTGVQEHALLELTEWSSLPGRRGARGGGIRLLPVEERIHEAHAYAVAHCPREIALPDAVGAELSRAALTLWRTTNLVDIHAFPAPVIGTDHASVWATHAAGEQTRGDLHHNAALSKMVGDPPLAVKHALKEIDCEIKPNKTNELLDVSHRAIVQLLLDAGLKSASYAQLLQTPFISAMDLFKADSIYCHPVIVRASKSLSSIFPHGITPFHFGEKANDPAVAASAPPASRRASEQPPIHDQYGPAPAFGKAVSLQTHMHAPPHPHAHVDAFTTSAPPRTTGHAHSAQAREQFTTSAPPATAHAHQHQQHHQHHEDDVLPSYDTVQRSRR